MGCTFTFETKYKESTIGECQVKATKSFLERLKQLGSTTVLWEDFQFRLEHLYY